MQITEVKQTDTNATFTLIPTGEELAAYKQHALKHVQPNVKVPGFRQKKVPLELIEKYADQNTLQSEFLNEAINHCYGQALEELKLRPVNRPNVSVTKFVPYTQAEFKVDVEVVGKITLGDYKKIKKVKKAVKISDKDVDEVVKSLQSRMAERKEVSRAAKDGDEVTIDFKGTDEKGEAVNGADGKAYPLVLGSNTFIPGFEPNIVGLKPGEEKTFTVTFPKDYGVKALQDKKVIFAVTVQKVSEIVEPKVDDSFAAKAGPLKTVKELREDIKKQLITERQYDADRDHENEVIKELIAKSKVVVPPILIEEQIERLLRELQQNISYRGLTYQEFLEREGKTEEQYRKEVLAQQAEERVKAGLILSEVAEAENIQITPEELEIRLQLLKGQYQDEAMQKELDKPENRREIASRMLSEKTIQKLVDYAKQ